MLMKKLVCILLAAVLALSVAACTAPSPEELPSEDVVISDNGGEDIEEEPNPEDLDPNNPQNMEIASGELPAVEGSDEFKAAFKDNAIDKEYLENIAKVTTNAEMLEVTNKAAMAWESQVNFTYDQLAATLEGEALEAVELEQTAWNNDLQISIEEIKEAAKDTGSSGNLDAAYKIMLVYRVRAAALLQLMFDSSGEVTMVDTSGEAVG